MRKLVLALSVPLFALAAPASAHFNLTVPVSILDSTGKKDGNPGGKGAPPCGPDSGDTGTITPATGGAPLTIHIDEIIGHPGYYRFALAMKAASEFPTDDVVRDSGGKVLPITCTAGAACMSATSDYEDPPKFPVIADHVFPHATSPVQSFPSATVPGVVMLPNVNCDKCILQVDEFMAQHPSNGPAGFMYHHCAYLKITADPNKPIFDPNAASGGAGGAGGMSSAGAGGAVTAGSGGEATGGTGGTGEGGGASAGAPTSVGSAGISAGGAVAVAGSPGAAGASASTGGAGGGAAVPASDDQSSGCSFGTRSSNARPELAALLGLLMLGVRRRRARAAR
jgi:hypothetical protein